jgi:uncharacterized damage-inducible protein DinB
MHAQVKFPAHVRSSPEVHGVAPCREEELPLQVYHFDQLGAFFSFQPRVFQGHEECRNHAPSLPSMPRARTDSAACSFSRGSILIVALLRSDSILRFGIEHDFTMWVSVERSLGVPGRRSQKVGLGAGCTKEQSAAWCGPSNLRLGRAENLFSRPFLWARVEQGLRCYRRCLAQSGAMARSGGCRYTELMKNALARDAVTFQELLSYSREELDRWRSWFNQNPRALDVRIEVAHGTDIRALLQHIILVELRYAEWLLGDAISPVESIATQSVDSLFSAADAAQAKWQKLIDMSSDEPWDEMMAFPAPMERLRASRRKCFVHTFLHSVRHWAQVATALRAAGYKQDWQHDFVFSAAME